MKRGCGLALVALAAVSLAGCKKAALAETEIKHDAPPQGTLPAEGWAPLKNSEAGVAVAAKNFDPGVVKLVDDDLDGDGKPDQATMVGNAKAGLYAIDIQLSSGPHEIVASGPLEEAKTKVLRRVGRGRHTRNCGYFNADAQHGEVRCGPLYVEEITLDNRAVSLFDTRSKDSTYVLWTGQRLRTLVMDGPTTTDKPS